MKRLLPYREEDGHDVRNGFALIDGEINNATTDTGLGDEGVFVKINAGDLNADVTYDNDSLLGKTDYPYVYDQLYSKNPRKIEAVKSGDSKGDVFGITLKETADYDENGEKLIYNREKADRQAVALRGQSVPVLVRGVVTLSQGAISGTLVVGGGFKPSTTEDGKVEPCAVTDADSLGLVLGVGTRTSKTGITDKFEGHFAMVDIRL